MSKYNEIENERNDLQRQVFELKEALKFALNYIECVDGKQGDLVGYAVSRERYNEWIKLVK